MAINRLRDHGHLAAIPWPNWLLAVLLPPPVTQPAPARSQHQNATDSDVERFAARLLFNVRTARSGNRHDVLRNTALAFGGMLPKLGADTDAIATALLDAVIAAGGSEVDRRNALATISWGLTQGRCRPLEMRHARR